VLLNELDLDGPWVTRGDRRFDARGAAVV